MTEQALAVREFHGLSVPAAGRFTLDTAHTTVEFVAKHMMFSKVRGRFTEFAGTITVAEDLLGSSVLVTVNTASVDTASQDRDAHLRSSDFFDAENHPTMTFRSTGLRHVDGAEFVLSGDLTIRGVTKPVDLTFEVTGLGTNPWGHEVFGVTASTEIDREEWGLTWNAALETGGVLVGKKVRIEIEAEAIREA